MSRRLNSNSRGRQSQSTTTRAPQLKLTFGGKVGQKNGAREVTTLANSTRKRKTVKYAETDSTTSGGETEGEDHQEVDEESEEADDESEDPEVDAPPRYDPLSSLAGPPLINQTPVDLPDLGEWTGFSEPDPSNTHYDALDDDFEKRLFDSDDDSVYERVNEVSDVDDDEAIERAETELLTAEFNEDMASQFTNQIEGMSAYGFGDDSDEEGSVFFPWSSSDETNDLHARHVHFQEQQQVGIEDAFTLTADSPTMSRALLPSALPEGLNESNQDNSATEETDGGEDYDSDATEELEAPAQAWKSATSTRRNSKEERPSPPVLHKRTSSANKGPVRGTFEDSGDKVTAILDSTGRKLLLSDPHLLGGIFARRFGPSVPASPSVGFSEAVFGESDSSQTSTSPQLQNAQPVSNVDPMFAGLITGEHASANGQATGIPEAFIPNHLDFMKDFISTELFEDGAFDPEQMLNIDDMITFDNDDEDDNEIASPTLMNNFQSTSFSAPNTPLPHLNHMNVTAFKRNTEPTYFGSSPHPAPLRKQLTTPLKRKRRATKHDSPYNDAHYQGVTPVQRVTAQEHELPSSPGPSSATRGHKRRKTIV